MSIVISAYNRAGFLPTCLSSLCTQTYPSSRYEIIVVDDGSSDGTADKAREVLSHWGGAFQVIQKANGGPASARNAGIRASQADVIAFIDSDCVADSNWLTALTDVLNSSDAAGVGGPLVNSSPKGWVSNYLNAADFYRHRVRAGKVDYLLTANVAFRRIALLQVKGFAVLDGVWSEDADLSFRLVQSGYTLLLAKQGIVTHYGTPVSVRGLIKNLYRYGYGNCVLSIHWKNGRTPGTELIRHGGAIVLSPFLALSYTRRVGLAWAVAFWPLIAIEHTAFVVGLISGMMRGISRGRL
ncbi:MAG TPA: glycosyltransferase [Ktedonobacterales bacterium]